MDERFFDEIFGGIRLGFRLGMMIGTGLYRGLSSLAGLFNKRNKFQKLIHEQQQADLYDESGNQQSNESIRAKIIRHRGDQ
jgi:hypothetical protein